MRCAPCLDAHDRVVLRAVVDHHDSQRPRGLEAKRLEALHRVLAAIPVENDNEDGAAHYSGRVAITRRSSPLAGFSTRRRRSAACRPTPVRVVWRRAGDDPSWDERDLPMAALVGHMALALMASVAIFVGVN